MSDLPDTRYASVGELSIAYQVFGNGEETLIYLQGGFSHIELNWEHPQAVDFLEGLGRFCRVIVFDRRGLGLSDRSGGIATLAERIKDVEAVMEAEGVDRASIFGVSEGGAIALQFAATHPERVSNLVLLGAFARWIANDSAPGMFKTQQHAEMLLQLGSENWGNGEDLAYWAPDLSNSPESAAWWGRYQRQSASPGTMRELFRINSLIELDSLLPSIETRTLVLHRKGDRVVHVVNGRFLAERLPNASLTEVDGNNHVIFGPGAELVLQEIEGFLTGKSHVSAINRVLATVLFIDIVDSTVIAANLGSAGWPKRLESFRKFVRLEVERHLGSEVDTAGDGYLARFDSPTGAIRCAKAISRQIHSLELRVSCGIHTGECELIDGSIGGLAVHIGARVAALAKADEILVSNTVKEIVVGSFEEFTSRGTHALKGVPGEWAIHEVVA